MIGCSVRPARECAHAALSARAAVPAMRLRELEVDRRERARARLQLDRRRHPVPAQIYAHDVPYVVALVELEEGVRMPTNIVDCAPEAVAAGMELEVCFRDGADGLRASAVSSGRVGLGGDRTVGSASATLARYRAALPRRARARSHSIELKRQLARVHRTSGFYRAKLASAGTRPEDMRSLEDFARRCPTSNKADFLRDQQEHPPFGTRLSVARDTVALVNMTGGTSGQGQEVYGRTHHDIALQGFLHYLPWFWRGCGPATRRSTAFRRAGSPPAVGDHPKAFASRARSRSMRRRRSARKRRSTWRFAFPTQLHLRVDQFPAHAAPTRYAAAARPRQSRSRTCRASSSPARAIPTRGPKAMCGEWGCALHEGYGSTQGAGFVASTCAKGRRARRWQAGPSAHLRMGELRRGRRSADRAAMWRRAKRARSCSPT